MSARTRVAMLLAAAIAIGAAHASLAAAAWSTNPYLDDPVATGTPWEYSSATTSDGNGGAFIVWVDWRSGNLDIYGKRLLTDGTLAPGWPSTGKALVTGAGQQITPDIMADGSGGAYLVWADSSNANNYDIRITRIDANGSPKAGWAATGLLLSNSTRAEQDPVLGYDPGGGAYVAWELVQTVGTNHDIRALRVRGDGTISAPFSAGGAAVCTAANVQQDVQLLPDGNGGMFFVWEDKRNEFLVSQDIFAHHMTGLGVLDWPSQGVPVVVQVFVQTNPVLVSDGLGGILVFWEDYRSGIEQIYGQRLGSDGTTLWGADILFATGLSSQFGPQAVSDGAGGAYLCWTSNIGGGNRSVQAQHVRPTGAQLWGANGVSMSTLPVAENLRTLIEDGEGGMVVVWSDDRAVTETDMYAQRIGPAGPTPLWTTNGVPISLQTGEFSNLEIVPDGRGGYICGFTQAYLQLPGVSNINVYAKRIDQFGYLGDRAPVIQSIADVPNDEGGQLKVSWTASSLDAGPYFDITRYRIWRSVPPQAVFSLEQRGRTIVPTTVNGITTYWEHVADQIASGFPEYSKVIATTSDSIDGSNPLTYLRVQAVHENFQHFWHSMSDSGYSVDNLAPPSPAPFTATYLPGSAALHWAQLTTADLRGYRVYRGATPDFVPGPGSFIAEVPDTGYVDASPLALHYKITAVDVHGNESAPLLVSPSGTVSVGPPGAATLSFARPSPNPSRGAIELRWTLPVAASVRLEIYDTAGRLQRTLASGTFAPGEHRAAWNGQDASSRRVAPGLYFARLESDGAALVRRIVRIE